MSFIRIYDKWYNTSNIVNIGTRYYPGDGDPIEVVVLKISDGTEVEFNPSCPECQNCAVDDDNVVDAETFADYLNFDEALELSWAQTFADDRKERDKSRKPFEEIVKAMKNEEKP